MCIRDVIRQQNNKRFWVMPWRKHFKLWTCVQLWLGQWASPMEALFWQEANHPWWWKPLPGLKRQYPISIYAVDFALPKHRIAIEIDGKAYHPHIYKDWIRQDRIKRLGWQVIRFRGSCINDDPGECVKEVKKLCE
jgi:very-short-patch-repair endonuclease